MVHSGRASRLASWAQSWPGGELLPVCSIHLAALVAEAGVCWCLLQCIQRYEQEAHALLEHGREDEIAVALVGRADGSGPGQRFVYRDPRHRGGGNIPSGACCVAVHEF